MGVENVFSRPGFSSYELFGLDDCFSHMTHEQLVNWVLCAGVYGLHGDERGWLDDHLPTFRACLESLLHRDHPDPAQRNGVMGLDSSRTKAEITTYDSLDPSLGQARNNLYLAVKTWAAYLGLEQVLRPAGRSEEADVAAEQARRCADAILDQVEPDGTLPAVFEGEVKARIIPAVEGLVFPPFLGRADAVAPDGPFRDLIQALRTHLEKVLVPGVCLFDDGGWKLSSTNNNSWLSKGYLCQYVARKILGIEWGEAGARADRAYVNWLTHPEQSYWSWSDQIVAGVIRGSKYYPRGVTCMLWLEE
jgi:hypothetical protein